MRSGNLVGYRISLMIRLGDRDFVSSLIPWQADILVFSYFVFYAVRVLISLTWAKFVTSSMVPKASKTVVFFNSV